MPLPRRICRSCSEPYTLHPNKPGHIGDCPSCSVEHETLYVAKVAFPSKNSCFQEIEITKDHAAAARFNGAQRRNGSCVTGSLIEAKS